MKQQSECPECSVESRRAPESEGQAVKDSMPPEQGLAAERLADLRLWLASRGYADPNVDRMIAARILERGDL